jgi:TonB family protein
MTVLADGVLKVSLVLAVALAALPLLRGRSAAVRHWVLATAFVCAAATPFLTLIAPVWRLPLGGPPVALAPRAVERGGVTYTIAGRSDATADAHEALAAVPGRSAQARRVTAATILVAVWAAGSVLGGTILLLGFLRLRRLARGAAPLDDPRWRRSVDAMARRAGIGRTVRLLATDHPSLLVTWGVRRPTIMLPSTALGWSGDRVEIVLQHELAHVQRADWLTQIAAEIVGCINWFNPIVWHACRQLRRESERACDDAVLNAGVPPADYATHLVDLARVLSAHRRPYLPAPAMARASGLEGRIAAMLNAHVDRSPVTRRTQLVAVAALLAIATSIAGLRAQRFSTLSGTLTDQTNAVLPNVAVNVANAAAQTRHEVRTDRTGHFELPGLPDGEYQLSIDEPGFKAVRETITIAGRDVTRPFQLSLGELHETLSIRAGADAPRPNPDLRAAAARAYVAERTRKVAERCAAGAATADAVGGNILQPLKVADFKPRYPEALQAAKVGGVVTLEALIGTDGSVRDVQLLSGDLELGAAAAEAIRQWEFSPTYLNCTPVEVRMGVTANFVAK